MCFSVSAHAAKKFLENMKMLVQLFLLHNFLHNHMRYIYRQIYNFKGKGVVLIKLVSVLFFTKCSSTKSSQSLHAIDALIISTGCGSEKYLEQILPDLFHSTLYTLLGAPH